MYNYYSLKKYMKGLMIKNEIVRSVLQPERCNTQVIQVTMVTIIRNSNELQAYAEQQEMTQQIKQEEKDKKRLDEWAKRCHHRKSTFAQPSIYNSPFLP